MSKQFEIAFNITSWIEVGDSIWSNVVGNFDKQGLSFGPRQNNIGQGTLQPLIKKVISLNLQAVQNAFTTYFQSLQEMLALTSITDQLNYVNNNWNKNNVILPDIKKAFINFGTIQETKDTFMNDAQSIVPKVEQLTEWISNGSPKTIRMFCLAFDIVNQNGGIDPLLKNAINSIIPILAPKQKDPRDLMRAIAWTRSSWTYIEGNKLFANDVLQRKLLIIEGSSKNFRGQQIDLEQKFGLSDEVYQ